MEIDFDEIKLDFQLNNAKLVSYYQSKLENDVIVKVKTNDIHNLEFVFKEVIMLIY